mgnify:CR=1 FL=1
MATLGKTEEFNSSHGNTEQYLEHLEQYFETNNTEQDSEEVYKRRAILISVIGTKPIMRFQTSVLQVLSLLSLTQTKQKF